KIGDQREREAAEADQAIHGQTAQGAERVLGLAGGAGGALKRNAELAKAHERSQPTHKARLLRQVLHHLDDLAIHEAKIAAVERDIQVADAPQKAIEEGVA